MGRNESKKYECPKCQQKFDDSRDLDLKFDGDYLTEDIKGSYCPACFVRFINNKVPKLKEVTG